MYTQYNHTTTTFPPAIVPTTIAIVPTSLVPTSVIDPTVSTSVINATATAIDSATQ